MVSRLNMIHAAILGAVTDGPSLFFDDIGTAEGRVEWKKALFEAGGRLEALQELVEQRRKGAGAMPGGEAGTGNFLKRAEKELEHMQAEKAVLCGALELDKDMWKFRRDYSRVMSNRISIVALAYIFRQECSQAKFEDIALAVIENIKPNLKELGRSNEAYWKTILDQLKDLARWGIVRLASFKEKGDGRIEIPYWPGDGVRTLQIFVSGTDLGLRFLRACYVRGETLSAAGGEGDERQE